MHNATNLIIKAIQQVDIHSPVICKIKQSVAPYITKLLG
ncbi:hypothetical protein BCEP4_2310012 [Burkholderia cepacia]|nr:hypothetical protein BCEP4_2310012 [Burkholderia cepacia]